MDTFLDVTGIVCAKQVLNFKNDSELAEYLGVSRATVSNWGARNSIDFRLLLDKFGDKVDYNWLLLGKRESETPAEILRKRTGKRRSGDYTQSENTRTYRRNRSVTLYDITVKGEPENIIHQQAAICTLGKIWIQYIRLRRGGLRQRRQHAPYIETVRHYRV